MVKFITNPFLGWIIPLFLASVFYSCEKKDGDFTGKSDEMKMPETKYFKGIITLGGKDGFGQKTSIAINFTGEDVKREVFNNTNKISHGMIYRKDEDSVFYFYTKEAKTFYTAIPKENFLNWVKKDEKPTFNSEESDSLRAYIDSPFGIIFKPFDDYGENVLLKTVTINIKNYGSAKNQTYLLGSDLLCNIGYSEHIKIKPEILALIEHDQPKTIPTLALTVFYTVPESTESQNLADKIFDKVNKVSVKLRKKLELNKVSTTDKVSIELPVNSKRVSLQKLESLVNPPTPSNGNSGGNSHHHHDFF